jgi:hypothetical protein
MFLSSKEAQRKASGNTMDESPRPPASRQESVKVPTRVSGTDRRSKGNAEPSYALPLTSKTTNVSSPAPVDAFAGAERVAAPRNPTRRVFVYRLR